MLQSALGDIDASHIRRRIALILGARPIEADTVSQSQTPKTFGRGLNSGKHHINSLCLGVRCFFTAAIRDTLNNGTGQHVNGLQCDHLT